jgi:SAM-dependent methyltransferase
MLSNWYLQRLKRETIALTRLKSDYSRVIKSVDTDALINLRKKVGRHEPDVTYIKYLDFEKFIPISLKRVYALGLHRAKPTRILDIGTGSGFFPLVCQSFGHTAAGIDVDHYKLFNDVIEILGVDRTVGSVSAYEPLPKFPQKFDLLTAFRVAFKMQKNEHGETWFWREKEWDFFLRDAASNLLTEHSRVLLDMNREKDGRFYTPELRRYFEDHGGRISKRLIYFETMEAFR